MAMEISGNYGGGYVSSYASQAKSDVGKTGPMSRFSTS